MNMTTTTTRKQRTMNITRKTSIALAGLLAVLFPMGLMAVETPTSYGAPAVVDAATVRVPMAEKTPTIDGVMEQGEWDDATAFSGFWYDKGKADFRFLAAAQVQQKVYVMYDKENLYVAVIYPVYPEGSWLRTNGRFPDVLMHSAIRRAVGRPYRTRAPPLS